jgi:hypothetical protein
LPEASEPRLTYAEPQRASFITLTLGALLHCFVLTSCSPSAPLWHPLPGHASRDRMMGLCAALPRIHARGGGASACRRWTGDLHRLKLRSFMVGHARWHATGLLSTTCSVRKLGGFITLRAFLFSTFFFTHKRHASETNHDPNCEFGLT